jgi:class 3 adenylate cyclase
MLRCSTSRGYLALAFGRCLALGEGRARRSVTVTEPRHSIDRLIASHRGRIFNTAGDSLVADFASALDAVQCAVAVQDAISKENADRPAGERMQFRIGIHGDIMVRGDNLFGDAVNIAARLEALAEPALIGESRWACDARLSPVSSVSRLRTTAS